MELLLAADGLQASLEGEQLKLDGELAEIIARDQLSRATNYAKRAAALTAITASISLQVKGLEQQIPANKALEVLASDQ